MIGMVLAASATAHYLHTVRQIAALKTKIASTTNVVEKDVHISNEEVKAIEAAISHIDLPWGKLFIALESAASKNINLISVEPDIAKGSVKIVGESLNAYDMLEYVRTLVKQPALHAVTLTDYEIKDSAPEQHVRFTLTALWG